MPLPRFLKLCAEVRSYQADEELRAISSRADVSFSAAGDRSSSKQLVKVLQDLNRIRMRPIVEE